MICDLHDEDIQALVQKRPLRSKCHVRSRAEMALFAAARLSSAHVRKVFMQVSDGWFQPGVITSLRRLLTQQVQQSIEVRGQTAFISVFDEAR